MNNNFHLHLPSNTKGRDFIVGDLQGCYWSLIHTLKLIGFDQKIDRLFSVGDLIDRGPNNIECASLVYEPDNWFYTIRGNHEIMMYKSLLENVPAYYQCWMENGGLWWRDEDKDLLIDIAERFRELPLIISVGERENRFNIVHAELIHNNSNKQVTNKDIDDWKFTEADIDNMVWGRTLVDKRTIPNTFNLQNLPEPHKHYQNKYLSTTYVGHSIVSPHPVKIEQQIYLDTGHVTALRPNISNPERFPLTLTCPQEQIFYQYHLPWKTLTKLPYDKIKTYK